ncbi:MAG: DNA cytosine methyltransferase, partial [Phycisphaeraceae bacterium]
MIARATDYPGLFDGLIIDLFAGAGGASTGIEEAFVAAGYNRPVDVAINHDPDAVSCHEANHPLTDHRRTDVFGVDPEAVTQGRRVWLLWASPDCTDFSKAKGGRPIRTVKRRSLAWVVIRWAFAVRPDVITLENVEEFQQWGLLDANGLPIRDGSIFEIWVNCLRYLGYRVEWRELRACDYGTPTTRNRLFVVARCDGKPIIWPEKTHGATEPREHGPLVDSGGSAQRTHAHASGDARNDAGASGLDPSNAQTGRLESGSRRTHRAGRPLRARHLKPHRSAASCIDFDRPMCSIFATPAEAKAWGRRHKLPAPRRPLAKNTQSRMAKGIQRYVIEAAQPFIVRSGLAPLQVRTGNTSAHGLHSNRLDEPQRTITTCHDQQLVAAHLVKHHTGVVGDDLRRPCPTIKGVDSNALAAVHLSHLYTSNTAGGQGDPRQPKKTVLAGGNHAALVAALLAPYYGSGSGLTGRDARRPLPTVPATERHQLVTALLEQGGTGELPAGFWRVWAFLIEHLGKDAPAPIVVLDGQVWLITDIFMRMLTPRELARCQGFRDDYIIDRGHDGRRLSKRTQVRLIGNSVCRHVSRALVRANVV